MLIDKNKCFKGAFELEALFDSKFKKKVIQYYLLHTIFEQTCLRPPSL